MNNDRGKSVESYFAKTNDQVPQNWKQESELMLFEKDNVKAKVVD